MTLTNPKGFEHDKLVSLKMARGTINIWSLFTKSVKLGKLRVCGARVLDFLVCSRHVDVTVHADCVCVFCACV